MQTAELKEYLGIVVDIEENIYLQQNLKSNIWIIFPAAMMMSFSTTRLCSYN